MREETYLWSIVVVR